MPCLIQKAPELGESGWRYVRERGCGSAVPTASQLQGEGREGEEGRGGGGERKYNDLVIIIIFLYRHFGFSIAF